MKRNDCNEMLLLFQTPEKTHGNYKKTKDYGTPDSCGKESRAPFFRSSMIRKSDDVEKKTSFLVDNDGNDDAEGAVGFFVDERKVHKFTPMKSILTPSTKEKKTLFEVKSERKKRSVRLSVSDSPPELNPNGGAIKKKSRKKYPTTPAMLKKSFDDPEKSSPKEDLSCFSDDEPSDKLKPPSVRFLSASNGKQKGNNLKKSSSRTISRKINSTSLQLTVNNTEEEEKEGKNESSPPINKLDTAKRMSLKEFIANVEHPMVMAFGNPLLDTIVVNENNRLRSLIDKFQLLINGVVEFEREQIQDVFESLPKDLPRSTMAGGSALNSMRFLQKLIGSGDKKTCIYFGAIGNDENGKLLKKLVHAAKVDARLGVVSNCPTGVTLAIITNENRSFAAHVGAASKFNKKLLINLLLKGEQLPMDNIKILYVEAFFLINNFKIVIERAKMAASKKIIIALNLSAEYVFESHERQMLDFMAYADIVFGNVEEYQALAAKYPIKYDRPTDIPFHLNAITSVGHSSEDKCDRNWIRRNTSFIMSQGGNGPALCVYGDNELVEYNIPTNLTVKDTMGAGDALVAGFLAGVLSGQPSQTCLNWGCKVAEEVIKHLGATLPNDLPDDFLYAEWA